MVPRYSTGVKENEVSRYWNLFLCFNGKSQVDTTDPSDWPLVVVWGDYENR